MFSCNRFTQHSLSLVATAIIVSTVVFTPPRLNAQQLEEIIVTAQRREQNLQEVPISIDVFTGADISIQGYSTMEDLSKYTPSVMILDRSNRVNATIRGFGTVAGSAQSLVSSVPFFVDGIHLGATQMAKIAFLDTERVEILKGPQPLYFGMNAVSGAFNITSRRPSAEWEGDATAEFGNDDNRSIQGGVGGPVSDTLGMRMAGMYQAGSGPLLNAVDGQKYGGGETMGGRILLQWTPNDKIDVVTKFEVADRKGSNDLDTGCLVDGDLFGYREVPLTSPGVNEAAVNFGNERSIWAPPPKGIPGGELLGLKWYPTDQEGQDCFGDKYGLSRGGPFLAPLANISQESGRNVGDGMIDIRAAVDHAYRSPDGSISHAGTPHRGLEGMDDTKSKNALLDITYRLDNGMSLNSQTGMIWFDSASSEENSQSPFFGNGNARLMDLDQFSQNLRLTSRPEGYNLDFAGGTRLEFMLGATFQEWQKEFTDNSVRANLRQGQRYNEAWEDARWFSGMWELSFGIMDDQLTFTAGGRWTKDEKQLALTPYASQWIFAQKPCDPAGTDANPATCLADPEMKWVNPKLTTFTAYDPSNTAQRTILTGTGNASISGVRVDSPVIFFNDVDMNNLWTARRWNGVTRVPLNWRGPNGAIAVGLTAPTAIRGTAEGGPYGKCDTCVADIDLSTSDYNNQFVLSYTPSALDRNHTFYAKYAEAFKGAVGETGQATIPPVDEMTLLPEYITAYEVGARGTLFDNRMRYDVTAFYNDFKDVQMGAARLQSNVDGQNSVALNGPRQVVEGLEFGFTAAATDRLTFNLGGTLMDGTMKALDGGGCSADEVIAVSMDVIHNNGGQRGSPGTAAERTSAQTNLNLIGPTRVATLRARAGNLPDVYFINGGCRLQDGPGVGGVTFGPETMNRSGEEAAFTPNWKFVLGVDYRLPVLDTYEIFFNARGFVSDGYLNSSEIFDRASAWQDHADLNLLVGFGPLDGNWRLSGYVRNLMEAKPSFRQEYELELVGFFTAGQESETRGLSNSSWSSYGVRLEYLF